VEKINTPRDTSRNPLFDISLVVQNFQQAKKQMKSITVSPYRRQNNTSKLDLTFFAVEADEGVNMTIEYCTALFKSGTIQRLAGHFAAVLRQMAGNPGRTLGELDILEESEKRQLLYDFNDTACPYPHDKTVHRLFEEQVERTPDSIAVVFMFHALTYRELNEAANRLARYLGERASMQGQPDRLAGILMDPCIERIIAVLGVLKSGAAYVPIEPSLPGERIAHIIKDAGIEVVLSGKPYAGTLDSLQCACPSFRYFLCLDSWNAQRCDAAPPPSPAGPGDLAYVIYTSGTTGVPRGVMVTHRSSVNLCTWHNRNFAVTARDRASHYAGFGFDASVWEIFPYLIKGAALIVIPGDMRLDIPVLKEYFVKNMITVGFLPTQACERFMGEGSGAASLRALLTGGDALKRFTRRDYALYNNYGPTENAVVTTSCQVGEWTHNIPIGKPIANNHVYILSGVSTLQPVGVPGELCISGAGLARGYLNRPELTAGKFVFRSYKSYGSYRTYIPKKIYKTGDLARWLKSGNLEFLGRIDRQVKIRGYRIELGEIEARLIAYEPVREAVVIDRVDETGDKMLCAYIVTAGRELQALIEALREHLAQTLPDYMMPAHFVELDEIPLTPSGKVDRGALPAPLAVSSGRYAAPRNEIERQLLDIWSDILGRSGGIGIDDNFFTLGGHSLKAAAMAAKIHETLGVKIKLADIFNSPTIRRLAQSAAKAGKHTLAAVEPVEEREFYELSFNQRRLWVIHQLAPHSPAYHMPGLIVFNETVDIDALEQALAGLFQRHESLRTGFGVVAGEPVQFTRDPGQIEAPPRFIDITGLDDKEGERKKAAIAAGITRTPFDLGEPPLFRSALVKQDNNVYTLIYCMHHIISDGWSMEILRDEFTQLYRAAAAGENLALKSPGLQYKDFAAWQNRRARQPGVKEEAHRYWKEVLQGGLPLLRFPGFPDGPREDKRGAGYRCVLDSGITQKLRRIAGDNNTTLSMVLFTLYNLLLAFLSGREEIVAVMISAGRNHMALYGIIGYFVDSVIVKNRVTLDDDFHDLLSAVNANVLEIFNHQDYPFELVLDDMGMEYPEAAAAFNFLNMSGLSPGGEPGAAGPVHRPDSQDVKFDLTLYLSEYETGIDMNWEYRKSLFTPSIIEDIAQKFIVLAEEITSECSY
jgi:bacitracin synthase 1